MGQVLTPFYKMILGKKTKNLIQSNSPWTLDSTDLNNDFKKRNASAAESSRIPFKMCVKLHNILMLCP